MSDLLGIGASGVRAYQSALTTVSENIANAATPGYAKRTADVREIAPALGIHSGGGIQTGQGVTVAGVTRSADALRAADVRTSSADLARSETGIAWLDRIETALTGNQLGDRLTGFFNAAKNVAADPSATVPRSALLEQASAVAGSFTATGKALDALDANLDATAGSAVTTLNSLGLALAKVNDGIGRAQPGSNGAAQLADQRDAILDQISAISDVSVSTDAAGRATVKLGNAGGPVLVTGNTTGTVTFARGSDGTVAFALQTPLGVSTVTPGGGALAGVIDGAARIADARVSLETIATAFTDGVNAVQAQGRDLDGNPGAALFTRGSSPTDITLNLTDARGIAALELSAEQRFLQQPERLGLQCFVLFDIAGEAPLQIVEIEQAGHERDLVEADLQEPQHIFAKRLVREGAAPVAVALSRRIGVIHHPFVLAAAFKAARQPA